MFEQFWEIKNNGDNFISSCQDVLNFCPDILNSWQYAFQFIFYKVLLKWKRIESLRVISTCIKLEGFRHK